MLSVPNGQGSGATPADDTEGEAAAALKVVPDDAPDAVADYIGAIREFVALSKVWENPQTGGIKQEYVGDFQRLIGVLEDTTEPTAQFVGERCPGTRLPESLTSRLDRTPSGPRGQAQAPPRPADVRVLLPDGPAGSYERVTVDVGKVTATNAEPKAAGGANPTATTTNSLLVDIEFTATTSVANQFRPTDFLLAAPSGTPIAGSALLDSGDGEGSTVRLAGRDGARGTVVFSTPELVRDVRGYALRVERDDRVPAVLSFGGGPPSPYPVAFAAGATGAFTATLTAACTDRYQTTVRSAGADLDADLGRTRDTGRVKRGRRWVTVVLQVTNVTPAGPCQAFSGKAAVVEMRLQADGQAVAPVNERSFASLPVGATGDWVYVFEVGASARSLALTGPSGEVLGRWTAQLPPAPGE